MVDSVRRAWLHTVPEDLTVWKHALADSFTDVYLAMRQLGVP